VSEQTIAIHSRNNVSGSNEFVQRIIAKPLFRHVRWWNEKSFRITMSQMKIRGLSRNDVIITKDLARIDPAGHRQDQELDVHCSISLLFILVLCMSCVWQLLNKRIYDDDDVQGLKIGIKDSRVRRTEAKEAWMFCLFDCLSFSALWPFTCFTCSIRRFLSLSAVLCRSSQWPPLFLLSLALIFCPRSQLTDVLIYEPVITIVRKICRMPWSRDTNDDI